MYGKKNPAGKFQKIPGKFQKWACAAREARGARPFLGNFLDFLEFSGIFFPYNTVALTRSCLCFFFFFFFLACNALEFCNKSMRHLKGMPPRKLCTFLRGNVDSAAIVVFANN